MTSSQSNRSPGWAIFRLGLFTGLVALAPACAPNRPTAWTLAHADPHDDVLAGVRVWQVVSDDGWGSAIELGGGRFLTCRHILPNSGGKVQLKAPGENLGVTSQAVGERYVFRLKRAPRCTVTIVAEGAEEGLRDDDRAADWAVFAVDPAPTPTRDHVPPLLDFGREVSGGTNVNLVGYPFPDDLALPPGPLVYLYPQVLTSHVWRPPPYYRIDPMPGLIMLDIVSDIKERSGLSGGPAIVWDSQTRCPVIVGLCQGSLKRRILGLPAGDVPIVIRPPEAIASEYKPPSHAACRAENAPG